MMMKHFSLLCLCLLLALCPSCTGSKDHDTLPPDLKIGYFPSEDILPYVVAEQQGYFDSLQVNIALRPLQSPVELDTLYQQGTLDGAALFLMDALRLSAQGTKMYPVMANEGSFYLIGAPDSSLLSLDQLNEKSMAVRSYSASDYLADCLIQQVGLTTDQVSKPAIDRVKTRLEMLVNAQVNSAVFQDPYAAQALRQGGCRLYTFNDLNQTLSVTAFSQAALKEKREAIRKLILGYDKAIKYMNTHRPAEWYRSAAGAARLEGVWSVPDSTSAYHPARPVDRVTTDSVVNWLKRYDLLPARYVEDVVDRTFFP